MSEVVAPYTVKNNTAPKSLEGFKRRRCTNAYSTGNYSPPTPEEIAALIKLAGWSQAEAARLVGAGFNAKGSSTIRKWKAKTANADHRKIPYSAWRHLLVCAGVVSAEDDIGGLSAP